MTKSNLSDNEVKTVIITGANGNLGTSVTNVFLERGYRVIATVLHGDPAKSFADHPNLEVKVVDLSDEDQALNFVSDCISKYNRIDGAVLLVGGFAMGDLQNTTIESIRQQINLNFETAFNITKPLFSQMISNNKGRIIFIGSKPALEATSGKNMIAYGLSKSLLFTLAEYLNAEAKGKDVTASLVVPSTIDTPANRRSMPEADPGKWVKPESLAEIIEFIISEKSAPLRQTVLKVYNHV